MSDRPNPASGFAHVETWVFDLDNTLYPPEGRLFDQIEARMGEYVMESLGPTREGTELARDLYCHHGTTLAGLVRLHQRVDPMTFSRTCTTSTSAPCSPSPAPWRRHSGSLPGRKFIFTNGSRKHAEAVAERLGVSSQFEDICDIHALDYIYPKPDAGGLSTASSTPHGVELRAKLRCSTTCRTISRPRTRSA